MTMSNGAELHTSGPCSERRWKPAKTTGAALRRFVDLMKRYPRFAGAEFKDLLAHGRCSAVQ